MEIMDSPNSITFNGKNSLDFGLYVSGDKTFNSPEKDYTKVSVPGRSGDLIIFNDRYKNTNVVYNAVLIEDYFENTEKIREWLLSPNGYCRLEDTYHPDEFRLACFSGPIDFDTVLLEAGSVTLTFDCKPQRFLKSAENVYNYTYNTDLNDTHLIYEPVMGSSVPLYVANMYYKKELVPHYYDIDEIHLAYTDEEYILLTDTDQPFDWTYNYNSYYIAREEVMINNPSSQTSKPLIKISLNGLRWKPNKYYKKLYYYDKKLSKPNDWETNYSNYYKLDYKKVGSRIPIPTWEENKYYSSSHRVHNTVLNSMPDDWGLGKDFGKNIPNFSDSETYSVDDYVIYDSKYYKCKTAIETPGQWDSSKWNLSGVVDDSPGYLNYYKKTYYSYTINGRTVYFDRMIRNGYTLLSKYPEYKKGKYYRIINYNKFDEKYELLDSDIAPSDWNINSNTDGLIVSKNYIPVEWYSGSGYFYSTCPHFILSEEQPEDWSTNYSNYYVISGYSKIPLQYPIPSWNTYSTDIPQLNHYYNNVAIPYTVSGLYCFSKEEGSEYFSSSKTYSVGDYVERASRYFRCVTEISTAGEWDVSKWEQLGLEPYDLTLTIPKGWSSNSSDYYLLSDEKAFGSDLYDSTKTYSVGDYVKYYGDYYKCLEEIDAAESFDVNKWDQIGYTKIDPNSTYDYELAIGTGLITLKSVKIGDSFFVDCENQECYDGHYMGQSVTVINLPWLKYFVDRDPFYYKNEKLIVTKWPTLVSGDNVIKEIDTNDICCTIQINPRWWKL